MTMNHHRFNELGRSPHTEVPLTWHIGVRSSQSETRLFYAQAAAVCHFLYDSSATTRKQLTDYVAAWYTGKSASLDARRAFGVDLVELGARVREYARGVVGD